jgi:hypothetical protein
MSDLHDRIARTLGWSAEDVRSFSMQSLRDLVRPVDPDLAKEMTLVIQSGQYVHATPTAPLHGSHGTPTAAPATPPPPPKFSTTRPAKKIAKDLEAAVHAAQLYIGKGLTMRATDEQKLYRSMHRKIAAVAKRRSMDEADSYRQIMNEAKRRGGLLALPGKDI